MFQIIRDSLPIINYDTHFKKCLLLLIEILSATVLSGKEQSCKSWALGVGSARLVTSGDYETVFERQMDFCSFLAQTLVCMLRRVITVVVMQNAYPSLLIDQLSTAVQGERNSFGCILEFDKILPPAPILKSAILRKGFCIDII